MHGPLDSSQDLCLVSAVLTLSSSVPSSGSLLGLPTTQIYTPGQAPAIMYSSWRESKSHIILLISTSLITLQIPVPTFISKDFSFSRTPNLWVSSMGYQKVAYALGDLLPRGLRIRLEPAQQSKWSRTLCSYEKGC